jgi:hypothetical protein
MEVVMKYCFTLQMVFIFAIVFLSGLEGKPDGGKKNKIQTNDHYMYIATNQIKMWISNNGDGSHDPQTDGNGLYWPGGINATKSAVFEDGLLFGGIVNGQKRVNGNTHRQGLQAGKIINGQPDDPSLEKYRIYKVLKGWESLPPGPERDQYEADYNQWPWEDGAPWLDNDNNGIYNPGIDVPDYIGDEMMWYVANDMDSSRSTFTYGTLPMGIEFQTTVFAFTDPLYQDMVFKRYLMLNKGDLTVDSMYVSYWSDVDLGDAADDFSGCDTQLKLAYTYNADNNDYVYGTPPPAIGYDLLQTPIVEGEPGDSARFMNKWVKGYTNQNISSFVIYLGGHPYYRDPAQGVPEGSVQLYNYMRGFIWNGDTIVNPLNGQPTNFMLTGDPFNNIGWYEGPGWPGGPSPGDRRHIISAGPFQFAPGDTQEVVFGILLAQGNSNLHSVQVLKEKDIDMKRLYNYYFTPALVGINDDPAPVKNFRLYQNYPNPFNPKTSINYDVPSGGKVVLKIYNVIGKEVATLVDEYKNAGSYKAEFNAGNLPSGVYFYKLISNNYVSIKKMMLLK